MKKKFLLSTVLFCSLQIIYAQSGQLDPSFGINGIVKTDMGARYDYDNQAQQVLIDSGGNLYVILNTTFISKRFPDGSIDSSYGLNGYSRAVTLIYPSAALQTDGKIVIAGIDNNNSYALTRLNSNGMPDSAFGNNGVQTLGLAPGSVAIQTDGKIVIGGYTTNTDSETFFAVARYNQDGSVDNTFNGNGEVITDFTFKLPPETVGGDSVIIRNAYVNSVAIQADGKIIAGGYAATNNNFDFAIARYNPDGKIDSTFDKDGKVTSDFADDDEGNALAIQTDGKIILAGYIKFSSGENHFAVARYNVNGSLDKTFSSDGKQTVNLNVDATIKNSVGIQSDGKIVIAGNTPEGNSSDFVVARFNTNGSPDNSFDGDGKLLTDFNSSDDYASSLAIQPDGKIVVAGYEFTYFTTNTQEHFAIARYNSNGSLDNSFDKDGKLEGNYKQGNTVFNSVVIQPDGKVVTAGQTWSGTYYDFAVARYNTNGSPDSSFNGNGKQTTHFDTTASAASVVLQSDGKIVVAGSYNAHFAIARYNTDGTPDNTFSGDGKLVIPMGAIDILNAVALQPDGKIVMAGFTEKSTYDSAVFAIARLNSNGTPDNTFNKNGKQFTAFNNNDYASAVAIQPDGKILVGGRTVQNGVNNFSLARYNSDGSLDTSFSNDGKQNNVFGPDGYFGTSLAIEGDGKIVMGGYTETSSGTGSSFVTARYLPNGDLDNTFNDDGVQLTNVGGQFEYGRSVAINVDNRIAIGGTNDNYALALFNADGSFDNTFSNDGIQITDIGSGKSEINSIAIADDKIYAAGYSEFPGSFGVIARYILSQSGPLPVSLLNFKAVLQNNSAVLLKWEIATEKNLVKFVVERSADANNFMPITSVTANGLSSYANDYTSVDEHPLRAMNFYRLKMIDVNGKFTYSNIIAVKINGDNKLQLFPNPVKDILFVQASGDNETATVQIIDAAGRRIKEMKVVLNSNTSFSIEVSALPAGIYNFILRKKDTTEAQTFIRR